MAGRCSGSSLPGRAAGIGRPQCVDRHLEPSLAEPRPCHFTPNRWRLVCPPNLGGHQGRTGKLGTGPSSVAPTLPLSPLLLGGHWVRGDRRLPPSCQLSWASWERKDGRSELWARRGERVCTGEPGGPGPGNRVSPPSGRRRPGSERSRSWEGRACGGGGGLSGSGPASGAARPGGEAAAVTASGAISSPLPTRRARPEASPSFPSCRSRLLAGPRAPASHPPPSTPKLRALVPRLLARHSRVRRPRPATPGLPAARSGRGAHHPGRGRAPPRTDQPRWEGRSLRSPRQRGSRRASRYRARPLAELGSPAAGCARRSSAVPSAGGCAAGVLWAPPARPRSWSLQPALRCPRAPCVHPGARFPGLCRGTPSAGSALTWARRRLNALRPAVCGAQSAGQPRPPFSAPPRPRSGLTRAEEKELQWGGTQA